MAPAKFDRKSAGSYKNRLRELKPDTEGKFGKMSASDMLSHLRKIFDTSNGDVEAPDESVFVLRVLGIPLMMAGLMPMVPGVLKTHSTYEPSNVEDFEAEKKSVLAAMDKFVEEFEADPQLKRVIPLMGPMTMRQWSVMHALHTNHHLKQFRL